MRDEKMPSNAWVEVRDSDGALLMSIPAEVGEGSISYAVPAFPPGTMGSIELRFDGDDPENREAPEIEELPTEPLVHVITL